MTMKHINVIIAGIWERSTMVLTCKNRDPKFQFIKNPKLS